jgi:signal transduction histidine kinase
MVVNILKNIAEETQREFGIQCELEQEGADQLSDEASEKICSALKEALENSVRKKDTDRLKINLTVVQDRAMFIVRSYRDGQLQSVRQMARWLYL